MKNRISAFLLILLSSFFCTLVMAAPIFSIVQTLGPGKLHAGETGGFRLEVAGLDELLGAFSVDVIYDASVLAVTGNVIFGTALGDADPPFVNADISAPGKIHIDQVSLLDSAELDQLQRDPVSGSLRDSLHLAAFLLTATGAGSGITTILPTNVVLSNDQGISILDVQLRGTTLSEPSSLLLLLTILVITLTKRTKIATVHVQTLENSLHVGTYTKQLKECRWRGYFSALIALFVVLLLGIMPMKATAEKTVMPLGDSLTLGFGAQPGYRGYLRSMFETIHFPINYVGTLGSPPLNHESRTGFTIQQIKDGAKWKILPQPNAVLLMAGTNDFLQRYMTGVYCKGTVPSSLADSFATELIALINDIMTDSPSTKLLVGSIPRIDTRQASGRYGSCLLNSGLSEDQKSMLQNILNSEIRSYNDAIRTRIAQMNNLNVQFVDVGTMLQDPADDYYDGVHPRDLMHYEMMAPAWFRTLTAKFGVKVPVWGNFYQVLHFGFGILDRPEVLAAGDVNRDGNLDLVVGDRSTGTNMLLGNADGSFQSPIPLTPALITRAVVIGDINRDSKLDLIVAGESTVSVLLGNGDSTFQSAVTYHYPEPVIDGNHLSVAIGDLNGDGYPDMAVSNEGGGLPPSGPFPGSIAVFINKGASEAGNFEPGTIVGIGVFPSAIAVGDMNGDGALDLITAHGLACTFTCNDLEDGSTVGVLWGHGDGTFGGPFHPSVPEFYNVGRKPLSVIVVDVNHDGKLDLVSGNSGSHDVSVLLGNGDGTFQTVVNYPAGQTPHSVTASDINGDGAVDLLSANFTTDTISILLGRGNGTFRNVVSHVLPAASQGLEARPTNLLVRDFNRDGLPDIVTANSGGVGGDGSVSILFNRLLGDFNADGCVDQVDLSNLLADVRRVDSHNLMLDLNTDGRVDIADARKLVTLFTKPRGEVCP